MKYNVGDLLQAKNGFIGGWIDNKIFMIQQISPIKDDPFVLYSLYCLENGRTLDTTAFTLKQNMRKLN